MRLKELFSHFNSSDNAEMKADPEQVLLYIGKAAPSAVKPKSSLCFQCSVRWSRTCLLRLNIPLLSEV